MDRVRQQQACFPPGRPQTPQRLDEGLQKRDRISTVTTDSFAPEMQSCEQGRQEAPMAPDREVLWLFPFRRALFLKPEAGSVGIDIESGTRQRHHE